MNTRRGNAPGFNSTETAESSWGILSCSIEEHGLWQIDGIYEKKLLKVRTTAGRIIITSIPTTEDVLAIVEGYLEAEMRNDQYVFPDGRRRPPKFMGQASRIRNALDNRCAFYKEKM